MFGVWWCCFGCLWSWSGGVDSLCRGLWCDYFANLSMPSSWDCWCVHAIEVLVRLILWRRCGVGIGCWGVVGGGVVGVWWVGVGLLCQGKGSARFRVWWVCSAL